jgi:Flp pilus assembly protein TadG
MPAFVDRLRRRLHQFTACECGNVAMTFALAVIPMIAFVGAAVDYSRANAAKAAMQAAVDSAALMLAKDVSSLSSPSLNQKASDYFNALIHRPDVSNVVVTPTYTTSGGSQLVLTATGSVNTSFMRVMGQVNLNVNVSSTVKWGNTRLRVALVLDTTGSMDDDGKITALKTATKNLLTQLQGAAAQNGDVYVSIVPFSKDVNLGPANYTSSWIDWTEWEDEPPYIKTNKPSNWDDIGPGDSCPFSTYSHGFRCQVNPTNGSSTTSDIPSSGTYRGYICPTIDTGAKLDRKGSVYYNGCYNSVQATRTISSGSSASCGWTSNCSCSGWGSSKVCTQSYWSHTWIKNARSTWNGCVTDRGNATAPSSSNYDQNITAPTVGDASTLYAAEQYSLCSAAATGLNYNWSTMTTMINNLSANGNTNQGLGLQLGWMSLVGRGPFTAPAMDSNYTYSQVIILMSDGLNTQNRWYTSQSSIDTREATTCANAKAAGITIYAIQVNTGGDPLQTVMQNCASTPDKFYMLTSANAMISTFQQIGTALSNLRVAK